MLYDHLLYGKTFGQFTNPDVDVVTTSNVQAMLDAWKNNDFSHPLPDPFTPDPFK